MTVRRTLDATFLNSVANQPDVRPFIGGDPAEPIDLTDALSSLDNIALVTEYGGWFLQRKAAGVMELHTLFGKDGRGKHYRHAAMEALRWLFTRTDTTEILTKVPEDNPRAMMASLWFGFRERFHRENAWAPGVGISYRALTIDDWCVRDPEALKTGEAFHAALEAAGGHENHPHDVAHDRAVGAALLMGHAGLTGKAVAYYNRWADFAGYAPVHQPAPHLLDIGTHVIELVDGKINVLMVRSTPT